MTLCEAVAVATVANGIARDPFAIKTAGALTQAVVHTVTQAADDATAGGLWSPLSIPGGVSPHQVLTHVWPRASSKVPWYHAKLANVNSAADALRAAVAAVGDRGDTAATVVAMSRGAVAWVFHATAAGVVSVPADAVILAASRVHPMCVRAPPGAPRVKQVKAKRALPGDLDVDGAWISSRTPLPSAVRGASADATEEVRASLARVAAPPPMWAYESGARVLTLHDDSVVACPLLRPKDAPERVHAVVAFTPTSVTLALFVETPTGLVSFPRTDAPASSPADTKVSIRKTAHDPPVFIGNLDTGTRLCKVDVEGPVSVLERVPFCGFLPGRALRNASSHASVPAGAYGTGPARCASHLAAAAGQQELVLQARRSMAPGGVDTKAATEWGAARRWVETVQTRVPSSFVPPGVAPSLERVLFWARAPGPPAEDTGDADGGVARVVLLQTQSRSAAAKVKAACRAIVGAGWMELAEGPQAGAVSAALRSAPYTAFSVSRGGVIEGDGVVGDAVHPDALAMCAEYPADFTARFPHAVSTALASMAHIPPMRGATAVIRLPSGCAVTAEAHFPLTVATGIPGFWGARAALPRLVSDKDTAANQAALATILRQGILGMLHMLNAADPALAGPVRQTPVVKELEEPVWELHADRTHAALLLASVTRSWDVVRAMAPQGAITALRASVMTGAMLAAQRLAGKTTASRPDNSPWVDFALGRAQALLGGPAVRPPPRRVHCQPRDQAPGRRGRCGWEFDLGGVCGRGAQGRRGGARRVHGAPGVSGVHRGGGQPRRRLRGHDGRPRPARRRWRRV